MISSYPLFTGLSVVLLCAAWASLLLPLASLPLAIRSILIVGITLLLMLPLDGDPAWYVVRGIFGDSSITALLFYIAFILQQNFSWQLCRSDELLLLRRLLVMTALLLYPFALGLTQFDSYSLGYANPWFAGNTFYSGAVVLVAKILFPCHQPDSQRGCLVTANAGVSQFVGLSAGSRVCCPAAADIYEARSG